MILTISPRSVPTAYIRVADAAAVLGVSVEKAQEWCETGSMIAARYDGAWWVTESDLASFVERSVWQIVNPPSPRTPVRSRRRR